MNVVGFYIVVSLFCAVFSLMRFGLSLGLLERPLVIGFLWALFSGDWTLTMSVAIFFELAWLDLIPAGTFIPPHLTSATVAALALLHVFNMTVPGQILVAILVSIPLAWLGSQFEARLRSYNSRSYNTAMMWLDDAAAISFPDRLVWQALGASFALVFGGFFVCMLALHGVVWLVLPRVSFVLMKLDVTWPHLWLGASLGGLLALRVRRAYAIFGAGLAVVMIVILASTL